MTRPSPHQLTQLLQSWSEGNQEALDKLAPLVYDELHRLARHYMRGERMGHTLQTTELVNEAYVRLIDWKNVRWQNRAHFFGVAAQMMRRILVDVARSGALPNEEVMLAESHSPRLRMSHQSEGRTSLPSTRHCRVWRLSTSEKVGLLSCAFLVGSV